MELGGAAVVVAAAAWQRRRFTHTPKCIRPALRWAELQPNRTRGPRAHSQNSPGTQLPENQKSIVCRRRRALSGGFAEAAHRSAPRSHSHLMTWPATTQVRPHK